MNVALLTAPAVVPFVRVVSTNILRGTAVPFPFQTLTIVPRTGENITKQMILLHPS